LDSADDVEEVLTGIDSMYSLASRSIIPNPLQSFGVECLQSDTRGPGGPAANEDIVARLRSARGGRDGGFQGQFWVASLCSAGEQKLACCWHFGGASPPARFTANVAY